MSDPQTESIGVHQRLLNAAEKVVGRDGVQNLTLEAVAREAGVSKGGLLYHFRSKSDLVIAIVERLASKCESEQGRTSEEDAERPGAFTRAYVAARAEPLDPQEEPIHAALMAAAGTDPRYLEPFRKRFIEWQKRLESDGIDPATATIIRLAVDGLCLGRLFGIPVPSGELRRQVLEKLMAMSRSQCAQTVEDKTGKS